LSQYHQDLYFQVNPIRFDLKSSKKENAFFAVITSFRTNLLEKIEVLFPHREALFLGGILIGARESMDYETLKNFNNSGLSHLIAVSGFNITIIIFFYHFFSSIFRGM
jgi:competence protein ComEC